jgi:uncharacterized membrane protein YecN with MAPEG domain
MPSPLSFPVTLATACILSLIYLVLVIRVSRGRLQYRISVGDGGNKDMLARCRAHANFSEYVPLLLVLMGLLEASNGNPLLLAIIGVLLILFRIFHAIGMPRPAPNFFRAAGAGGTFLMLAVLSLWGLILVFTA